MTRFHVVVSTRVAERFGEIIAYVDGFPLYNTEAAQSIMDDFEETKQMLSMMADSIQVGAHPVMQRRSLRRINFRRHQYFVIYRIKGDRVEIVRIGHFREDFDRILR